MVERWWAVAASAVVLVWATGCGNKKSNEPEDAASADTGFDAGPPDSGMDAGPPDAGYDAGMPDAGYDAGHDAGWDAGYDAGSCNPVDGIECDGDWEGRCADPCDIGECCSPQQGEFACMPRDENGLCPAADLWVDASRITDRYNIAWRYFEADDCAFIEGCVQASGWRRLLYFDTWTPNTGTADMFLGDPEAPETASHFEYSECHDHHHFDTYAAYELRDPVDDSVEATGHKQAFCLLDFYAYPSPSGQRAVYHCDYQGIQRGFQDVYSKSLDCQWVDVTDVAAGDYALHVAINTAHILNETNYANNQVSVPVTIPPDDTTTDVTQACTSPSDDPLRSCGFTRDAVYSCNPGDQVTAGCSTECGLGSCTNDPIMRICAGDQNCVDRLAIASSDDSGCGGGRSCSRGGDCCPATSFTCPAQGQYTVLWAAFNSWESATCMVDVSTVAVDAGAPIDSGTPADAGASMDAAMSMIDAGP